MEYKIVDKTRIIVQTKSNLNHNHRINKQKERAWEQVGAPGGG